MVKINSEYQDKLRVEAVHCPSSASLLTDAPRDNHGLGESFSPTDLVATGLMTCIMTIMGIRAQKEGWDLAGMKGSVEKHMASAPRRIAKLDVIIQMPGHLLPDQRSILETIARECPVAHSLAQGIEQSLEFKYGA